MFCNSAFQGRLIQHDQIRRELVQQDGLPLLIKCLNDVEFDAWNLERSLEMLWTMTFNPEAAEFLKRDSSFITTIKKLSKTVTKDAIKKSIAGILWKLEKEDEFVAKQEKIEQMTSQSKDQSQIAEEYKYGMMISYSHDDKDLCYRLHERLIADHFRVWVDKENLYGPQMEEMAQAIENSEFVLLCMSASYKQSVYCRAEAQYAFTRQRNIIPLKMTENYHPDGWLGFLTAPLTYIDFHKHGFDNAYDKLMIEIQRYRSIHSNSVSKHKVLNQHGSMQNNNVLNHPGLVQNNNVAYKETPPLIIQSSVEPIIATSYAKKNLISWSQQDVQSFLNDTELKTMLLLCEKMNGAGLYQTFKMCESSPDSKMYQILNEQLRESHGKTLPISEYSRFLTELRVYTVTATDKSCLCTLI
ncbi:unnamed protein product [Didymodactylos carnosus]|uniref:TIR domain-containing protein n=1 Tax=Didymodactylos carnosus TaxID=1234261 RepID=A0A8S2NF50_9BILA|nr:unnamed protein product [Didymodactylos carnosus]CAF3995646.1 unnamed protein product [Didymodactylos carnosus]